MSENTITIDGQIYSADSIFAPTWIVRWYKPEADEGFVEANIVEPDGANWTPEDAIRAAIARGSWA